MDRQLAERMVGAACLLAVLVLVVPAILDGNPDSGATITHPAVEESLDLRTHTIRLDSDEREPPVPTRVQAGSDPEPPAAELPASDVQGSAAVPVPESLPSTVPSPSPAAPTVPVPDSDETPDGAARSEWFVQLGSFSRRDNADRLVADLKRKGFTSFVQGGGGSSGTLFRVRAGPGADKAAAEALAGRLAAAGFTGGRVGRE